MKRDQMQRAAIPLSLLNDTDAIDEARNIARSVGSEAGCIFTGSIAAGLGNGNSDLDFYIVGPDDLVLPPRQIGFRHGRHVDIDWFTGGELLSLASTIEGVRSFGSASALGKSKIDRYFRVAIGDLYAETPLALEVKAAFTIDAASRVVAIWSQEMMVDYWLQSCFYFALPGREYHQRALQRESFYWYMQSVLASLGEPYPHLKWTFDKAHRAYGRDGEIIAEWKRVLSMIDNGTSDGYQYVLAGAGEAKPPVTAQVELETRLLFRVEEVGQANAANSLWPGRLLYADARNLGLWDSGILEIGRRFASRRAIGEVAADCSEQAGLSVDLVMHWLRPRLELMVSQGVLITC